VPLGCRRSDQNEEHYEGQAEAWKVLIHGVSSSVEGYDVSIIEPRLDATGRQMGVRPYSLARLDIPDRSPTRQRGLCVEPRKSAASAFRAAPANSFLLQKGP
jgi:hypothetical protein